jgi:hypothetical protein
MGLFRIELRNSYKEMNRKHTLSAKQKEVDKRGASSVGAVADSGKSIDMGKSIQKTTRQKKGRGDEKRQGKLV